MVASSAADISPSNSARVETAYLLAIGFVEFAQWPPDRQANALRDLLRIAQETDEFRRANAYQAVICQSTEEGLLLAFLRDVQAPARCALQLVNALKANQLFEYRIGLHSGKVTVERSREIPCAIRGEELTTVQWIRDYGDVGHLLVSDTTAHALIHLPLWPQYLHDLEVRGMAAGAQIPLFSLYDLEFGNRTDPEWVRSLKSEAKRRSARAFEMRGLYSRLFRSLFILGLGLAIAWYAWPYANRFFNILPVRAANPAKAKETAPSGNAMKDVRKMLREGRQQKAAAAAASNAPKTPRSREALKAPPLLLPSGSGEEMSEQTSASEGGTGEGGGEAGGAVEELQPHSFERTLQIPADGLGSRKVRITYEDGSTAKPEVLLNELHAEGDTVPIQLVYRGRHLTLRIYYDDWFVQAWKFGLPAPEPDPELKPAEKDEGT